jgi:hypothetical protein
MKEVIQVARGKAPERCPHRWCLFCRLYEVGFDAGDELKGLVPEEFGHHMSTAQREALLAFRSILDRWLGGGADRPGTRRRPQKVKVE